MKVFSCWALVPFVLFGCGPSPKMKSGDPVPGKMQPTLINQADSATSDEHLRERNVVVNQQIRALPEVGSSAPDGEVKRLLQSRTSSGHLSEEALRELLDLVPKLEGIERFWEVVGAIPSSQRQAFRDNIVNSLKTLPFKPDREGNRVFRNAFRVASDLQDPEVARIALKMLPAVPTYRTPDDPPPKGWPEATRGTMDRLVRGDQGILASIVVASGDAPTMTAYRAMLDSAPKELQQTMIWALGHSANIADFEFLVSHRAKVTDPKTENILKKALNRIPHSMDRVANCPEVVPVERRSFDPKELLQTASECRTRLKVLNLVVPLTMYD